MFQTHFMYILFSGPVGDATVLNLVLLHGDDRPARFFLYVFILTVLSFSYWYVAALCLFTPLLLLFFF